MSPEPPPYSWAGTIAVLALTLCLTPPVWAENDPRDAKTPSSRRLPVATPQDALQAVAVHGDRVVVVGSKGLVLESHDGGGHFEGTSLPGRPPLIDVAACGDGRIFLLDFRRGIWSRPQSPEAIASSWERRAIVEEPADGAAAETPAPPARPLAIHCDPAGQLWGVGDQSSVLRSVDGGGRWRRMFADRSDRLFTAVGFADARRGRVVGEFGTYLESDDGGASWRSGPSIPGDFYPHAAAFSPDGRSWVVGNTGSVFRLDPGASAWVNETTGSSSALYGAAFVGTRLVAVGAGGRGVWREVRAAGASWRRLEAALRSGVARDWRGIAALGEHSFLSAGAAGLILVDALDGEREHSRPGPAAATP